MLFMAQHPERFANKLIAELQGVADSENRSPFWECLGRHFFNMDFTKANYLTGINSKGFIADLMPHYPVYVPLLSDEAQASLGQPRPDMIDVKSLLEEEGFGYRRYVDIFDAGPTLEARTQDIRTVAQSKKSTINIDKALPSEKQVNVLLSNTKREDFRCAVIKLDPQQPEITAKVASLLHLNNGDNIRIISL
jgi:arginine N-succinyltransferase